MNSNTEELISFLTYRIQALERELEESKKINSKKGLAEKVTNV